MAGSASSVYRLIVDQLRQECVERGLDRSGPVRVLWGRLAEHIKSKTMERAETSPGYRQVSRLICPVVSLITSPPLAFVYLMVRLEIVKFLY
jgi:hypothetical protein